MLRNWSTVGSPPRALRCGGRLVMMAFSFFTSLVISNAVVNFKICDGSVTSIS